MAELFNVDAFRASLGGGGARPNQFKVSLLFPAGAPIAALLGSKASFLITAASLPGMTLGTATVMYRGRAVHLAGDRVFQPWSTTVLNDNEFSVRSAVEEWMNSMEDLQFKVGNIRPELYYSNLMVEQLDRNGNTLKAYTLVGAFPTDISDVPLSYDANDLVSSFGVTWTYQHLQVGAGLDPATSPAAALAMGTIAL